MLVNDKLVNDARLKYIVITFAELITACCIFLTLLNDANTPTLYWWGAYMLTVSGVISYFLSSHYQQANRAWHAWLPSLLSALGFSCVSVLYLSHVSPDNQFAVLLAYMCLASFVLYAYSKMPLNYILQIAGTLMVMGLFFLIEEGAQSLLGWSALIYAACSGITFSLLNRQTSKTPVVSEEASREVKKSAPVENTTAGTGALLEGVIDNLKDAIIVFDEQNKVTYLSKLIKDYLQITSVRLPTAAELNAKLSTNVPSTSEKDKFKENFLDLINSTVSGFLNYADGSGYDYTIKPLYQGKKYLGKTVSLTKKEVEVKTDAQGGDLFHDPLTGLYNASHFNQTLAQTIAYSKKTRACFAVLMIDIDSFKKFNDRYSRIYGDKLLMQAAERLKKMLGDSLARVGADSFGIILTNLIQDEKRQESYLSTFASKCLELLEETYVMENSRLSATASIGIGLYPKNGDDEEGILKHADIALNRAKENGGNTFQYFTPEMNKAHKERLMIESHLHNALQFSEFILHFQPIANVRSKKLTGTEILLRWHHPVMGEVSPATFIPVAEHNGMIIPISQWILETTCGYLKNWQRMVDEPFYVSFNLSYRQYTDQNFIKLVAQIIEKTGVSPSSIAFEFSETMVMKNFDTASKILHELKKLGIRLTMDNFGTGMINLKQLHQLPLDKIKIDSSFIQQINLDTESEKIIASIIKLVDNMGFKVAAEGIENENQIKFLLDYGCDEMQGFFLYHPMNIEPFSRLLKSKEITVKSKDDVFTT